MREGNTESDQESNSNSLKNAIKEGALFSKPIITKGGTGLAPNADLVKQDDGIELEKIAEGFDPDEAKRIAEASRQAKMYNPQEYENQRTKSMVFSQREVTEAQLEAVRAQNEEAVRAEQRRIAETKAKKTGLKITLIIMAILFLVLGTILAILIINSQRKPVQPDAPGTEEVETTLPTVEGYDCETEQCGKVADLPDGRIILRDTAYYIYDRSSKRRSATTIDTQDYNTVKSFIWGGKTYLTLDPNTEPTALFSVSENRYITSYSYDTFYGDINDGNYNEMRQIEGSYIVASANGSLKLVDLTSGTAVVSGKNRVFVHDGFYFGYESGNTIYAYTKQSKVITKLTTNRSSQLFTREGRLFVVKDNEELAAYSRSGEELSSEDPIFDAVSDHSDDGYLNYLQSNSAFYKIPSN